jgi:hypothetical protein
VWLQAVNGDHLCLASDLNGETLVTAAHYMVRSRVERLKGRHCAAEANVHKLGLEETGRQGSHSLGIRPEPG